MGLDCQSLESQEAFGSFQASAQFQSAIQIHLGLDFNIPPHLFDVVDKRHTVEHIGWTGPGKLQPTVDESRFEAAIKGLTRPASLAWLPSLLSPSPAQPTRNSRVMVVDFGGTHTKVAVRSVDNSGKITWQLVCDVDNNEKSMYGGGAEGARKLTEFCKNLAIKVKDRGGVGAVFDGVAVIWSNSATATRTQGDESDTTWVGAAVADKSSNYRKGELYVTDLQDGDPVHQIVAAGLSRHICFKHLVCGNDTVFTSLALPGSRAGIVCSTGVNSTGIVDQQIYNLESGRGWLALPEFLGVAEKANYPSGISVENLIGGSEKFLPAVFKLHLQELTKIGAPFDGLPVGADDSAPAFDAVIISGYANTGLSAQASVADNIRHHVARLLHHRAGYLLAQLAYLSVWNQVNEQNSGTTEAQTFPIAIDSTLLRGSAVCLESFTQAIAVLNDRLKPRVVTFKILQPRLLGDQQISVPTLGAAASLDRILQKSS
jgi:hypothetical protein